MSDTKEYVWLVHFDSHMNDETEAFTIPCKTEQAARREFLAAMHNEEAFAINEGYLSSCLRANEDWSLSFEYKSKDISKWHWTLQQKGWPDYSHIWVVKAELRQ